MHAYTHFPHPLCDSLPHVRLDVTLYVKEVILWGDGEGLELQQVVKNSGVLKQCVVLKSDGSLRAGGSLGTVQVLHLQNCTETRIS